MGTTPRLHAVDALRGLAIVAILLLHNLEHFDFYHLPEQLPAWLKTLDAYVWDTIFFLFASKAFCIFALLFGLTFSIQHRHQRERGRFFNTRFAWRLLLLVLFGLVNSAFFHGDILMIYALIGFLLIPLNYLGDRALLLTAFVLLLLPLELGQALYALTQPPRDLPDPASWAYFARAPEYWSGGSLAQTIVGNLTNGKEAVFRWYGEQGRYFLILAYFLLGLVAGRRGYFLPDAGAKKRWQTTLLAGAVAFALLYPAHRFGIASVGNEALARPLDTVIAAWKNAAFVAILVGGFLQLFHRTALRVWLEKLIPLGKASLSNYVFQSILGTAVYYGWGLGLWEHTGATYSLLIGLTLVIVMGWLSARWLRKYKRGPLESLWHWATWRLR